MSIFREERRAERCRVLVENVILDIARWRSAPRIYVVEADGTVVLSPPGETALPPEVAAILGAPIAVDDDPMRPRRIAREVTGQVLPVVGGRRVVLVEEFAERRLTG